MLPIDRASDSLTDGRFAGSSHLMVSFFWLNRWKVCLPPWPPGTGTKPCLGSRSGVESDCRVRETRRKARLETASLESVSQKN